MGIDIKVCDIIEFMEVLAPCKYAYSWDNVGLQIGNFNGKVEKVLTTLDVTDAIIDEAIKIKADMIIAHHPLIFSPVKNIVSGNSLGEKITKLIKNDIALYIAHTNLDVANGGTNDIVMDILEITNVKVLNNKEFDDENIGIGRVGILKNPMTFEKFIEFTKEKLNLETCSYSGELNTKISKIGICTGAGSKYMMDAKKLGCDLYITGDVTYHQAQQALENDLCLLDATHFSTEIPIKEKLAVYINEEINKKFNINEKDFAVTSSKTESFMKYL